MITVWMAANVVQGGTTKYAISRGVVPWNILYHMMYVDSSTIWYVMMVIPYDLWYSVICSTTALYAMAVTLYDIQWQQYCMIDGAIWYTVSRIILFQAGLKEVFFEWVLFLDFCAVVHKCKWGCTKDIHVIFNITFDCLGIQTCLVGMLNMPTQQWKIVSLENYGSKCCWWGTWCASYCSLCSGWGGYELSLLIVMVGEVSVELLRYVIIVWIFRADWLSTQDQSCDKIG